MRITACITIWAASMACGMESPHGTKPNRGGADGPGGLAYQWYLISYPPLGHPLMNDPRVEVIAVVLKDAVDNNKPFGYPDYFVNSVENLARHMADHLEYQGFFRGGPRDNGQGYGGAAMLLNWGVFSDYRLQTNLADAVDGGCGRYTLFNATGCASGPGTLASSTSDFMNALKAECDRRGLTYPEIFIQDFENRAGVEYSFRNADVYPFDSTGNWDRSVEDPRYATEVLVTLGGNKTLADLVAGQPALPRTSTDYFFSGADNQAWSKEVYNPIEERVHDEALYRTFGVYVNAVFPGAVWGNYSLQLALDPAHPYRDQNNNWFYWSQQDPSVRLRATLQAPICYGPRMSGGASYDPVAYPELGLGVTEPEVWRNFAIGQVRAAVSGGNTVPTLPHMETPGMFSGNILGQYTPTIADVAYVLSQHAAMGQHRWLMFNPDMTAVQANDLLAAITMFDTMTCPANCDGSTAAPVLNVNDFSCFLNRFAAGDSYANCDGSTSPPILNVLDFSCFLNKFAAGCP